MNINEFRQALESDATKENKELKEELTKLRKQYNAMMKESNEIKEKLLDDCRTLANRCYALAGFRKGDFMCFHCELREYRCKHEKTPEEKLVFAKMITKGKFK